MTELFRASSSLGRLAADPAYRRRLILVYLTLAVLHLGAWSWALVAFAGQPVLIGVGVVVYGLGLRHAVDADHIAAIDNVTRKLLQQGQRSVSIGFWFASGHSAVVILATAAVVAAAATVHRLAAFREIGAAVSTGVSGMFLLLVAGMNLCILRSIIRAVRRVRAGHAIAPAELDMLFTGNGLLSRVFRPLFRYVSRPWHMALLGFLFGLSFDTATEVALFGISATQAAHGVGFGAALVFPMLFAAGMALFDTTDGVMMVSAYHWALENPLRKLYYNLAITLMSIAVALFVGAIQLGTLSVRLFGVGGRFAWYIGAVNRNMNLLGMLIVGSFVLALLLSVATFKWANRSPAGAAPGPLAIP